MTYDTVATISQVTSLLMFIGMFLAVARLRLVAQERPALRGGAAARARPRPQAPQTGLAAGGANDHAEARYRRRSPASRPPATSGTASRSSTSRCRRWWVLDLLRHHRLGRRLLDRLSGVADAHRLHQGRARLQPARDGRGRGQGARTRQAQYRDKLATHAARPDQGAIPTCCASPWPAARRPSRPTARPATAAAPRASPAIPTSTTTTGCGAARSRTSTRPSASASARIRRTRAPRRCRATASTSCSTTRRSTTLPSTCCRCRGKPADAAAAGRGQKVFAEQCASCHGADGKGKQEQGAPNLTDGIWLYGGSQAADHREHQHRPRRHDARLGGPARSRHPQGARRLRPQPRRRQ